MPTHLHAKLTWHNVLGMTTETCTEAITIEHEVHATRRPLVTWFPWFRSQLVNLAADAPHAWYWQCPRTGCKRWSGTYQNAIAAKEAGYGHVRRAHR